MLNYDDPITPSEQPAEAPSFPTDRREKSEGETFSTE
jgi:hypothetical protein